MTFATRSMLSLIIRIRIEFTCKKSGLEADVDDGVDDRIEIDEEIAHEMHPIFQRQLFNHEKLIIFQLDIFQKGKDQKEHFAK